MSFNFIFMLTSNDKTIPNALEKLDEVLAGGVRHIGFKDVGLPFDELKRLAKKIREVGDAYDEMAQFVDMVIQVS